MRLPQRELHQRLRAEAVTTRERIAAMIRPLDASKLNEHPEPAGWSVGQVLEHLCVADQLYEAPYAALLRRARPDAGAPAREWRPSFIGGLIAGSLLKPRPLKGPKVFRPGPTPRNGVVEELLARELNFVNAMDDAASYDWRALRIGSPALPSWAPKMNLGDGFRIHVVHLTRHSRQIERLVALLALCIMVALPAAAQRPTLSRNVRQYVAVDTPTVALTHVRVIDGTGAPARESQTLVIRDGRIVALGDAASTPVPAGAQQIDLTGKSVIPGLVMLHEHLYYPTGGGTYGNLAESFTRLYLAGGVTSMRTGGNMNGYGEINVARAIDRGEKPGPWIDASAPYLQGPGLGIGQLYVLKDAADARRLVNFWADAGATSFKAYMNITRDELRAAVDEAHKRGLKVTGHLCSVTYREAIAAGIDDLEHGFFVATDFVPDKQPDLCPGQRQGMAALAALDTSGATFKSLVADLVSHHVALTSTLTVFETFTPGQPLPPGLDVLDPILAQRFTQFHATVQRDTQSVYRTLFAKERAMEVQFARAGGLLVAGTDPTGAGGVIPGYSDQRQVELLVGSGFTPLEAIRICTLNGATYLGKAGQVGSIAVGKQADLVVIAGNPAADVSDIRKVEMVFKQGVGYDPAKLIASVKGSVGLF